MQLVNPFTSEVLTANIKPETIQLIASGKQAGQAMKRSKVNWRKHSPARKEAAAHLKKSKSEMGSKALRTKLREPVADYPTMSHLGKRRS